LFADERNASILATASYDDQYYHRERLSNLREWTAQISPGPNPYTGTSVPVLTLPVIESSDEERQRLGLVLNADARFDQSSVYWRSNYSSDETKRNRDLNDTNPAIGTPLSLTPEDGVFSGVPLSMRNQDQDVQRDALNLSLGGKTKFSKNDADIVIAYVQTHETEPHTFETGFLSDHDYRIHYSLADPYEPVYTLFDETVPGDTTSETNPSRYHLNYFYDTVNELEERDGSAKFNLKMNLGDVGDYLKFGGKAQQRRRKVNTDRNAYDAGPQPRDMNGLIDTPPITMQTVGYRYGPVPSASSVASLLYTDPATLQLNSTETQINSTSGDYQVTENIWALYAMGKLVYTKWSLLGGVRVEGTHVDSTGMAMNLDSSGQLQDFTQIDAVNDYIEVLPGLHFRYEPKTGLLYRGSVTRSMSRPNSADIAPYRTLSFVDHRSRIGAPDLKPYLATNFDVSLDWYDPKYGLISVAAFYKKIDHFITDSQYPVIIGNLGEFIEFKRVNGESARALGGEFSWQSPNWNLPLTLGKANIDLNYNYNHGEAHHPTRPNETFPLPRQVDHQANLQFHDVRGSLSIDATVSYRTGWWEDLIAPGFDNYIISAWDAEISGAYKIGKHIRITAGASNLLDRPTRHYAGIETRMNDSQYNGREYNLGLQWKT
jgi:TonB-dependent receptor